MMNWMAFFIFIQVFFGVVIGLYFWGLLRNQRTQKVSVDKSIEKRNGQIKEIENDFS